MTAELRPGQLLDQFFERADAAGERHEGVRALEHDALALVHVARDDQFGYLAVDVFAACQKFRDHADDVSALGEDRGGDRAHQADGAAAIDQPGLALGQQRAERDRGFDEARIGPGTGTAIDADISNRAHGVHRGIADCMG